MFKNLRTKFAALLSLGVLLVPAAVPAVVAAADTDINSNLCGGASLSLNSDACSNSTQDGSDKLQSLVRTIVNVISLIVGIVSVIMIIVGGFRYVTSGGASDSVTSAKNTIIYAIIGLVVVALAQFIVQFVLSRVTSTS